MLRRKLKLPDLRWGAVILLVASFSALAYIPPSQFILKNWVSKHSGMPSHLRIRTLVKEIENGKPTGVQFKDTTWVDLGSLSLKSVASSDQDQKLFGIEKRGDAVAVSARFLLGSDLSQMTRALQKVGVPIQTPGEILELRTEAERRRAENESLVRWDGRIAWMIGTQLWIEKDTFFPLRLVYTPVDGSQEYDVRFGNLAYYRHFPFPRTIQLFKKGSEVLSCELLDISPDHENSGSSWGRNKGVSSSFTEEGDASSSALRNLIQAYYESLR